MNSVHTLKQTYKRSIYPNIWQNNKDNNPKILILLYYIPLWLINASVKTVKIVTKRPGVPTWLNPRNKFGGLNRQMFYVS